MPNLRHTNKVKGAYVTTGARTHLFRYLDMLREKSIYCDTDSVIYTQPRDEPRQFEIGDKLRGHDLLIATLREHTRICERGIKELCVQVARYCVRTVENRL